MADALELEENMPAFLKKNVPAKSFTYKDYYSWGEDVRCELINGVPHMMSAPGVWHQQTAGKIHRQVDEFLDDKPCLAFIAPFDVRLSPQDDESDILVVQPDVLVVCDREKLSDGKACRGAPDFAVEVVSEGSLKKDFVVKKNLYEKAGVREYWVVDNEEVYKYVLLNGKYHEKVYKLEEKLVVEVDVLPGCSISFRGIVGLQTVSSAIVP